MKNNFISFATALLLLGVAFAFMTQKTWKIGKGYAINFSNDDVVGVFEKFDGTVSFDKDHLETSKFDFTVDIASVNTGNETQNNHLQNKDWLDAKAFPKATYKTKSFLMKDNGYVANGTLEIHGIQKEMSIPLTVTYADGKGEIKTKFEFNRLDFQVGKKGDGVAEVMRMEISIPIEE